MHLTASEIDLMTRTTVHLLPSGEGGPCPVVVSGRRQRQRVPLAHVAFHSPSGFAWGYPGSGPADLALSILAYYLPAPDGHTASVRGPLLRAALHDYSPRGALVLNGPHGEVYVTRAAYSLHQKFKDEVLAHLSTAHGHDLPGLAVLGWLMLQGCLLPDAPEHVPQAARHD